LAPRREVGAYACFKKLPSDSSIHEKFLKILNRHTAVYTLVTQTTGPKISSFMQRDSSESPTTTVGGKK
jgi:hypothetical protein